jgi:glycerol-3-phosphate cytidylyltransferase
MRRVITYGTFDLFHQGHYNILKRAKEEGDYLIVGVTGENYDLERGKLSVQDSLAKRIENVKNTGFADLVIVEEYLGQKIQDIIKYNVDVLVIGSDWKGKFDHLSKYCEVKYLERTRNISSTQLREENLSIYRLGIVTDDLYDNDCVLEPKHVSGIHVECVFAEDPDIAGQFSEKYELDRGFTDYDEFLNSVDIVYIKTERAARAGYAEKALIAGKHVVCEPSLTLDPDEIKRLESVAKEHNALLLLGVTTLYLNAFGQLLWMVRGNLIGDIVSIKCSISRAEFGDRTCTDFYDLAYYPLSVIIKCLGTDIKKVNSKVVKNESGAPAYAMVSVEYEDTIALAEMSNDYKIDGGMTIMGTRGKIIVPDDWWNVGYFKLINEAEGQSKRYSSNHDGNGYRYLFQSLVAMIKSNDSGVTYRISNEEALAINDMIAKMKQ